jgi:hypothetical protein
MTQTQQTHENPVAPACKAVLDLFDGELAEVKFPEIDRETLDEAAREVQERFDALIRAEAALALARETLQESQEALMAKCQRAVAYARVYAEDNSELGQRLEAISLPRGARQRGPGKESAGDEARPAARRAPRGHKQRPLFLEGGATEGENTAADLQLAPPQAA